MEIFTEPNASCLVCAEQVFVALDPRADEYQQFDKELNLSRQFVVKSSNGPELKRINPFSRHKCTVNSLTRPTSKSRTNQIICDAREWSLKRIELAQPREVPCTVCLALLHAPCRNMSVKKEFRANKNYHDRRIYDGLDRQGIKLFVNFNRGMVAAKVVKTNEVETTNTASFPYVIPQGINIKLNFQEV